jgi:uncharacterized HAD superfamily protein
MGKDTRLKLGVDIDGVLADWTSAFSRFCEGLFNREFPRFATSWNLDNWGFGPGEFKQAWEAMCADRFFYSSLSPLSDLQGFEFRAFARKHRVYFVTTRPWTEGATIEYQTANWLGGIIGVSCPTVLVTENKGAVAAALGLDAFIDDKPENLADVHKNSPATWLYLRDWPYNRPEISDLVLTPGTYQRVKDFRQFAQIVGGITVAREEQI